MILKVCTARNADHASQGAVFANTDIVSDLDQVVNFRTSTDAGLPEGRPVHRGAGPNLHFVLQHHPPDLGNFHPSAFKGGIAKAITANGRTRMDDTIRSDLCFFPDGDVGIEDTSSPDAHPASDINPCIDDCAVVKARVRFYHGAGTQGDVSPDGGRWIDHRRRVNTRWVAQLLGLTIFQYHGEGQVGLGHENGRYGEPFWRFLDQYSGCLGLFKLGEVLDVSDKAKVAGSCLVHAVNAGDGDGRISADATPHQGGDISDSQIHGVSFSAARAGPIIKRVPGVIRLVRAAIMQAVSTWEATTRATCSTARSPWR